jgi:hypothetical protein
MQALRQLTSQGVEERTEVALCLGELVQLVPRPVDRASDFLDHLISSWDLYTRVRKQIRDAQL